MRNLHRLTGFLATISVGLVVVALARPASAQSFAPYSADAGPIWNQADADVKCPALGLEKKAVWTGEWWTTVPGSMSVCQLVPAVMIEAYDSTGKNTGTCVFSNAGGYYLEPCSAQSATQLFAFDPNGPGGPIYQRTVRSDAHVDECLTVPAQVNPWSPGSWVARRACNGTDYTSKLWRWTNGVQIIATQSPNSATCLTADGVKYLPPRLVLGDCSTPQLTQWNVVAANRVSPAN